MTLAKNKYKSRVFLFIEDLKEIKAWQNLQEHLRMEQSRMS